MLEPSDNALAVLEPLAVALQARDRSERAFARHAHVALNAPERMPLPAPFEARDPVGPLRAVVERLTAEQAEPEARKLAVDPKLDERLEHKTPQFVLRNIPRVQREVDPWIEYKVTPDARPDQARLLDAVREARYEAPALVERFSVQVVRDALEASDRWLHREDWTRYFCRERKEDARGPLWKQDPDAQETP